jgi:hypothetical protein
MTRMRGVKPDLLRHEGLIDLEAATGLPIRLCFIGLLMCADRDGRFQWKPRTLKAEIMPHDQLDFGAVMEALASADFVRLYSVGGKEYGWIPGFRVHQRVNNKEQRSTLPPHPAESCLRQDEASLHPDKDAASSGESGDFAGLQGKERKGREGEGERKGKEGRRDPDEFPSPESQSAERIVATYPANGNRYAAMAAVAQALRDGEDPAAMLLAVKVHATCWRTLPAAERRFCPGLETYFGTGRWRDDPAAHPWTLADNVPVSGTAAGAKKIKAPPDVAEIAWLAAAREMWPDMDPATRKADIPVSRQRRVDELLANKRETVTA